MEHTLLNLMINNTSSVMQPPQAQRTRNDSGGSAASSLSSSGSYSPSMAAGNPHMMDITASLSAVIAQQQVASRKPLDRSLSEPAQQQQQQQKVNANRYKTELCRPYEENGYCKYGNKCQFAHGAHELRSVSRHPKYKSDLCRTYHTTGFCPYGPRCHFIHNEDERKLNQINQMKREYATQQAMVVQQQQQQRIPSPPSAASTQQPARVMNQTSQLTQQVSEWQQQSRAVGRPRNLDWSLPLSMGSAASSITESPIPSPTSSMEEDHFLGMPKAPSSRVAPPPGFTTPPATAPATYRSAFTFPPTTNLRVATTSPDSSSSSIPSPVDSTPSNNLLFDLAQGLQNTPSTCDQDVLEATQLLKDIFLSTPNDSSLDSIPETYDDGLDFNHPSFRLPIFSQLSQES